MSQRGFSVLVRSNDHGQSWKGLNVNANAGIAINQQNSAVYVATGQQVLTSSDNGDSWRPLLTFKEFVRSPTWAAPNNLYLATNAGNVINVDADSGQWRLVGTALTTAPVDALAVRASTPRRLYAVSNFHAFFAVEGEADWIVSNKGLPNAYTRDVAVAASEPSVAYAATVPGFFKTDDGGKTWKATTSPTQYAGTGVNHVEADPLTPDTVYAAAGEGLQQSRDGGLSWKTINPSFASSFAVAPSNTSTLYAALSNAMSKSTNGGATWIPIMSGLSLNSYSYYGFYFTATSVAVAPSNSSTVYLGNSDGLFNTTDAGGSWNRASKMTNVSALAIDATNPSVIYATSGAGVVKSPDGGLTWMRAGLIDKVVTALAISPTDPPVLYAGARDGFVYRSTTGGAAWDGFSDGLARAPISRLSIDASGAQLYAGTTAGVYEYHFVGDNVQIARLSDDLLRLPRLLDQLSVAPNATGFILPVVGTATGVGGSVFATDVTLSNNGASPQDVLVAWLQQENTSGSVPSFRLTLPALSDTTGGGFKMTAERLGISGIGSLVVVAVAGPDSILDANASIDGSAVIWTHPADGRAPLSQSVPAVRYPLFSEHSRGQATGFRHDTKFRTNVGIVNLSSEWHQFTIAVTGERTSNQFTLAVAPFSLVQTAVPPGDYGALSLVVFADTSSARWTFYGSSIDNVTGEARTSVGMPSGAH
jgi:photosystem II stability/assembly factor-like uncharacterized protein